MIVSIKVLKIVIENTGNITSIFKRSTSQKITVIFKQI